MKHVPSLIAIIEFLLRQSLNLFTTPKSSDFEQSYSI